MNIILFGPHIIKRLILYFNEIHDTIILNYVYRNVILNLLDLEYNSTLYCAHSYDIRLYMCICINI